MKLALMLGTIAALADIFGGLVLVRRDWDKRYLRYFVALGAGFMMAAAFLEMLPESFKLSSEWASVLVLAGYCAIHLLEHTMTPHFHFGEETHHDEFLARHTGDSVLLGLGVQALFDGVAIGSGVALSRWLGWVIFLAIFLHKIPEGFTVASVMIASGRSRARAFYSAVILAGATVGGVLVIALLPDWVRFGLPVSAGVAIYVAATDLVPEVNRQPGIRMALVFFLGVVIFFLLRLFAP
jgi:zinc transporter ZupT